jgi:hypothetical protein
MCQKVGGENIALSSTVAGKELRDLVALPAGLSAFRPHPSVPLCEAEEAVEIPWFGRRGFEFLVQSGSKLSLGCRSRWKASVLLGFTEKFAFLLGEEAVEIL